MNDLGALRKRIYKPLPNDSLIDQFGMSVSNNEILNGAWFINDNSES